MTAGKQMCLTASCGLQVLHSSADYLTNGRKRKPSWQDNQLLLERHKVATLTRALKEADQQVVQLQKQLQVQLADQQTAKASCCTGATCRSSSIDFLPLHKHMRAESSACNACNHQI